ncbi:pyruvate kinase [Encephalitozoon hellem ATCC 50504]|uniref:Pyruvate kinase n=2 Tax=Encephalitozoon hellem TaxID=27973 RepID=A0A9Q9C9H4_ENCHE|nr:pyruvate kinase [Encephalitozoon hellem ATCC 50504]AFM98956.1 pyruvate kinase [Encephalitozoon hellem ATCC 50504]UTX43970.1 pyruvate kinase [Encephalitozoon hellem]WEL39455.1 pyruvate kinase [Encephalitozoon hellem]|eukprot:XP_003887937.1 pyruvate kinase [Encephalitozoon hellem ATCC 50504]
MREALTKIVCTIGPSTSSRQKIRELIDAGMSVARINFSHGSREAHLETIRSIKDSRCGVGRYVAIALDTRGPEVRIRTPEEKDIKVNAGDILRFSSSGKGILIPKIDFKSLSMDDRVFIDDGAIDMKVTSVEENGFGCKVMSSGVVKSNKSMNFPNIDIGIESLSNEDKDDIMFGVRNGIDMIFVSFVNSRRDVEEIRRVVGSGVPIVSKVESCLGMRNLGEIALSSDGVMIARGDLGVEIGLENMFSAQKKILLSAKREGKPVICATQMMESMILKSTPNRSEISDVGNAVIDGCDCVMLSGETAVGAFPIETVKFMRSVCIDAEEYGLRSERLYEGCPYVDGVVICFGESFEIERMYLRSPTVPIVVISNDKWILRRFSICRGMIPVEGEESADVNMILEGMGMKGRFLVIFKGDVRIVNV